MKRFQLYFVLIATTILLQSCSLKHKWLQKQQEQITHSKQEHLKHALTSKQLMLDTTKYFNYSQLQYYHLWTLSGNVQIQPDGSLRTNNATLQTWHKEVDSQQTRNYKTIYEQQAIEDEVIMKENSLLNKKVINKEKRKLTTNLWWLLLLLLPLAAWLFRKRWL